MTPFDPKNKKDGSNREGSNHSAEEGYGRFAKDKRARKTTVERVERTPRASNPEQSNTYGHESRRSEQPQGERRSFNQRFDRSNRSAEGDSPRREYRQGDRPQGERRSFNQSFDRGNRSAEGDSPRKEYRQGDRPQGERRSFNPNFDRDNRPVGHTPKPYKSRGEDERKPFRENKDFNREDTGRSTYKPHQGQKTYGKPSFPSKGRGPKPIQRNPEDYPRFNAPKIEGEIRLNRFIAMSGICSRREADDLITSGSVTVNGVTVIELGTKILSTDDVRLGEKVVKGEKNVYIVMNKPKGFVTSVEDPHSDKTVMDLLKNACTERVYPVGRLDKNSLGVLLITNDGDLTKRLTHPSYNKKKVYQVMLDKALTKADMEQIAQGLELEDGFIAADAIEYVGESRKEVGIEIHSGRNRIVRRIFEELGYQVRKLDRVYFAGLTKQRMKRGQWRFLTPKEVAILKSGEYE